MIRRPGRIPVTFAALASLVLCVAVCVLWTRSYWVADSWVWWRGDRHNQLQSAAGQISLSQWRLPAGWPTRPGAEAHADVRHKRTVPDRPGTTDWSIDRRGHLSLDRGCTEMG
jgi:hypothetical protein